MSQEITTIDNNKFLNFQEAKVQSISLDQLRSTHKEVDVYGKPLKGIHHYELIDNLVGVCNSHGFDVDVWDLFAAHNNDRQNPGVVLLPQVEAIKGERAVEAHIIRRCFCNIRIKDFDSDGYTTNLSVAFHQRGIQVGFGNNVIICHNQCMLNADLYAATYSEQGKGRGAGLGVGELINMVENWICKAEEYIHGDRQKIERMKQIDVTPDKAFQLVGILTAARVAHDTHDKRIRRNAAYPLNQTQISDFTEQLMIKYNENNNLSLWDLYDTATTLYKATSMDIPSIMPQNRAFIKTLEENFNF